MSCKLSIMIIFVLSLSIGLQAQPSAEQKSAPSAPPAQSSKDQQASSDKTSDSATTVVYNELAPPLVSDKTQIPKLKMLAPQWAVQQFDWLTADEIAKYKGRANPQDIAE
ncbi:MAG: hypothetical protein N2246_00035, partial [Candidatus Sumerlaeia bacterium]|nr:hypothetical protein [Candidatus Sumerlaeia bacterium]